MPNVFFLDTGINIDKFQINKQRFKNDMPQNLRIIKKKHIYSNEKKKNLVWNKIQ